MTLAIENIIKKVVKRACDLFLEDNSILNINSETFDDEFFNNKFGAFIEIADQTESITSLGDIEGDTTLLNNIIYVLVNAIKTLSPENIIRMKNNELTIRIWLMDNFINHRGQTEQEKIYGISVNKPGILINKNNQNFYCWLPSIWEDQSDAVFILQTLSENAGLDKDAWKGDDVDLITFKSNPLIIN